MVLPFLFALALSLDGLFVGLAYGVRSIRIPLRSLAIIALCTGVSMGASLAIGHLARGLVSERTLQLLGAAILAAIGVWQMFQGWVEYLRRNMASEPRRLLRLRFRDVGIVVQVLKEPQLADADASGLIDAKEAVLLGTALGLDSFGAGFAAAFLRLGGPIIVPAVALGQVVCTAVGLFLGRRFEQHLARGRGLLLPGALLCLVALLQLA